MECRLVQIVVLPSTDKNVPNTVVFGEVVGIHIRDDILTDGLVDYALLDPIGRLGYMDYTRVNDVFTMHRPE